MIADYERFHGAVLRALVVQAANAVSIQALSGPGRISNFLINAVLGLQIKHCSKRLAPWAFTFTDGSDIDLQRLSEQAKILWFALVCGQDGILAISYDEYIALTNENATRSKYVRVDRDRGTMYHVSGNAGQLQSAKPRGVAPLVAVLDQYPVRVSPATGRTLPDSDIARYKKK